MKVNIRIKIKKDLNVLIMDENPAFRKQQIEILKMMGFKGKIFETSTCEKAKKFSDKNEVDFFILDWKSSDDCSQKYLQHLRSSPISNNIPIMIIAGEEDLQQMMSAIDNGASSYVVKPITTSEYIEAFQEAYEKHQG